MVYKPIAGQKPLWDFPDGRLAHREAAAYLVSELLGWNIVPRTGPLGEGMVLLWQETDPDDVLVNNADRKGDHIRAMPGGHRYWLDHGLTFHEEHKLRTVLWGWIGQELNAEELAGIDRVLEALDGELGSQLAKLLTAEETASFSARCARLRSAGVFPAPSGGMPAVP